MMQSHDQRTGVARPAMAGEKMYRGPAMPQAGLLDRRELPSARSNQQAGGEIVAIDREH